MAIKLVVDSASDIDKQEAAKLGIELISLEVTIGGEQYFDGETLSHEEFFKKLVETTEFPKTSQVNEFTYNEVFSKLLKDEQAQVICITLSSKLSGTYNSAKNSAKKFENRVHVVDSLNVCIGERILIEYAIKLIKQGKDVDYILSELESKKHKIKLLALLNTLKYLQMGGRISAVTAVFGSVLNVKPVIAVIGGEVKLIGKAMGSKNGKNLLNQLVAANSIDFSLPFAVGYSGLSNELLAKYLEDSQNIWENKNIEIPQHLIGCTIGSHVGPGAIAVAYFAEN